MIFRKLEKKDAPLMIEWMHDYDLVKYLNTNFLSKSIEDCYSFINNSVSTNNVNFAVCSDEDEYMGTVSLKNIDDCNKTAEFAIVFRKQSLSKGYSSFGMKNILDYGFIKLNLDIIYWYVSPNNSRAINFYNKNGYYQAEIEELKQHNINTNSGKDYIWYLAKKQ